MIRLWINHQMYVYTYDLRFDYCKIHIQSAPCKCIVWYKLLHNLCVTALIGMYGLQKHVGYLHTRGAIRLVLVISCLSTPRVCFAIRTLHTDCGRPTITTVRWFISLRLELFYVPSNSIFRASVKISQHKTKSTNSTNEQPYSCCTGCVTNFPKLWSLLSGTKCNT